MEVRSSLQQIVLERGHDVLAQQAFDADAVGQDDQEQHGQGVGGQRNEGRVGEPLGEGEMCIRDSYGYARLRHFHRRGLWLVNGGTDLAGLFCHHFHELCNRV